MRIQFLGHSGFCIETSESIIVMDPWLSPFGAYDSAWFQYPKNHHLADGLRALLATSPKPKYVYISHEHKDHFDEDLLQSIDAQRLTFVLPGFRRSELRDRISRNGTNEIIVLKDGQELAIPGAKLTIYLDDREISRDSAVLLESDSATFLNLNDCKIHDRLPEIVRAHGKVDIYTCQFSGASWHPTCYQYS